MKKTIKFFIEFLNKYFPKKNNGLKKYNLTKYQIYPEGKYLIDYLDHFSSRLLKKINFNIEESTCIGTCFAERLAEYLNKFSKSYNILEKNVFNFEANWGRVYTPKNLLQLIKYSTDPDFPIYHEKSINGYIDPIRDYACGTYDSKDNLISNIKQHRTISKKILLNKKFIFITLGQMEVWYDNTKFFFWGNTPSKMNDFPLNKSKYTFKDCSFEETKKDLSHAVSLLKKLNPELKIIFTLSPVPAYATFNDNANVVIKSLASKCLLRTCIEEISEQIDNCYYFPSFEYVMTDNQSFIVDNRHVRDYKVEQIFKNFRS